MNEEGLKNQHLRAPWSDISGATGTDAAEHDASANPEFIAALGIIVTAFVDLGFGVSPADHAKRAANDNWRIRQIVEDFEKVSN